MTESIFGPDYGGGMKSSLGWLLAVVIVVLIIVLILYVTKTWPFNEKADEKTLDGFDLYYQRLNKMANYLEKRYEMAVKEQQKATGVFNNMLRSETSTKEEIEKAQQRMFAATRYRNDTQKMAIDARNKANEFKKLYL